MSEFLRPWPNKILQGAVCAALAACSSGQSVEVDQDEKFIKMVQAANGAAPPVKSVQPAPLSPQDIRRHDLTAPNCTFAPGTNLAPRVIAREADAYMKYDGVIHRFAADPGARTIIGSTRSVYNGRAHVLRLELEHAGQAAQDGEYPRVDGEGAVQGAALEGLIELHDPHGRVVYSGSGVVKCD